MTKLHMTNPRAAAEVRNGAARQARAERQAFSRTRVPGFELEMDVRGRPVPQGALVRSPAGGLYHRRAKDLDAWRTLITTVASECMGAHPPFDGPVSASVAFRLERPAAHFLPANSRRPVRLLRADAPAYVTHAPDIDKLARSALDALTAVVFRDDSQVAQLTVVKRYCDELEASGAHVLVRQLQETR